jgi:hypothetical protein
LQSLVDLAVGELVPVIIAYPGLQADSLEPLRADSKITTEYPA